MSTVASVPGTGPKPAFSAANVRLAKRVNEALPALHQVLSAHDVARLTRRRRWVLYALSFIGRFPRQQRFQGHAIGWHRRDLADWLDQERRLKTRLHRKNQLGRLGWCKKSYNRQRRA